MCIVVARRDCPPVAAIVSRLRVCIHLTVGYGAKGDRCVMVRCRARLHRRTAASGEPHVIRALAGHRAPAVCCISAGGRPRPPLEKASALSL
eukprot:scaffold12631_cov82-Isochrysis_galbana.AAC.3